MAEWWTLVTMPMRPCLRPSTTHSSQSGRLRSSGELATLSTAEFLANYNVYYSAATFFDGDAIAAQTLGTAAARHKLRVSVITAVLAALAGALMAHYAGFITPAKASFMHSGELVIMVVFGGMASVFGAVVGAALLAVLPQLLTVLQD